MSFPTTWATSILFPNNLGDEREGITTTKKKVAALVVVQSLKSFSLCDPMDCSTPGFLVLQYFPEFAQIYVQ